MKALYIEGSNTVPTIELDKTKAVFSISGKSLPENTESFYFPVFDWFDDYAKAPLGHTEVVFRLNYINTSSSMMLHEILKKLYDMQHAGHSVKVLWHYEIDDEEILDVGEEFKAISDIPFDLIPIEI